ncbi:MAG: aminopeptidase, partial [Pseudomonadota bacterium]|nr:aminopeptidase [Pseudomonadota bacterium]
SRAVPIERAIADPRTSAETAEKLALVRDAAAYAAYWGLDVGRSYRTYAALDREATVWTVFRAEPLALRPIQRCWPIAGCVPYQGFFDEARAEAFAARARGRGEDVSLGPVDAYATLGWFPDPIASPALDRSRTALVELVIHESAHNTVYRPGDADFNEALANTVAFALVRAFWAERGVADDQLAAFFDERAAARRLFFELIEAARSELFEIYAASEVSPGIRLQAKAAAFDRLRANYAAARPGFGAYNYDRFFAQDLNNAHLVSVGTYEDARPMLEAALYGRFGGDLRRFMRAMEAVARSDEDWRLALARLGLDGAEGQRPSLQLRSTRLWL